MKFTVKYSSVPSWWLKSWAFVDLDLDQRDIKVLWRGKPTMKAIKLQRVENQLEDLFIDEILPNFWMAQHKMKVIEDLWHTLCRSKLSSKHVNFYMNILFANLFYYFLFYDQNLRRERTFDVHVCSDHILIFYRYQPSAAGWTNIGSIDLVKCSIWIV